MSIYPSSLKEKFQVVQYVPWELKRTYFLQAVDKDGNPDNRFSLFEVLPGSDKTEAADDFFSEAIETIIGPDEEIVGTCGYFPEDEGGYIEKWEADCKRKDTGEETRHEMFFKLIECGDSYANNRVEET